MVYTDARSKPKSAALNFWWPLRSSRCFVIAEVPVQDLGCLVAVKYVIRTPTSLFSVALLDAQDSLPLALILCRLHSVVRYRFRRELDKCG